MSRGFHEVHVTGNHGLEGHALKRKADLPPSPQGGEITFASSFDATGSLFQDGSRISHLGGYCSARLKNVLARSRQNNELRVRPKDGMQYDMVPRDSIQQQPPSPSTSELLGLDNGNRIGVEVEVEGPHEDSTCSTPSRLPYLRLSSSQPGSGGGNGSRKRSMQQAYPAKCKKRPRDSKQGRIGGLRSSTKRPTFPCPYFRHSATEDHGCLWSSKKLTEVKEHCKTHHLKPFRCKRCKKFRAGNYEEIEQHLKDEDCEKPEDPDSSEGDLRENIQKASGLDKAKNWQSIYEILFSQNIPNSSEESQTQVLAGPTGPLQADTLVSRDYRAVLENLLGGEQESVENLPQ